MTGRRLEAQQQSAPSRTLQTQRPTPPSRALEAQRQSALIAALFAPGSDAALAVLKAAPAAARPAQRGERLRRGLAAYRANGQAIAERAAHAAWPTLAALMGEDDFNALARALWHAAPPRRGDVAQWGRGDGDVGGGADTDADADTDAQANAQARADVAGMPAFIEAQRDLHAWPYLADCARLDAALRDCESAADARCDRASLSLLANQPPGALVLHLMPDVRLLRSHWPIATIHAAHARGRACADGDGYDDDTRAIHAAALQAARDAIAARRGERVVVARGTGWRAVVTAVDDATWRWMRALQAGEPLDRAHAAAGAAFDFAAWLLIALQGGWIHRVQQTTPAHEAATAATATAPIGVAPTRAHATHDHHPGETRP